MNHVQASSPAPQGYNTVCPYLLVNNVAHQIDFIKNVFQAEISEQLQSQGNEIQHGEVRIGDSIMMVGKASEAYPTREGMNYVFVVNVDEVYRQALDLGASAIMEPGDRFYGYRECGFKDLQGNHWWVAQVIEVVTVEEMERRMASMQNT